MGRVNVVIHGKWDLKYHSGELYVLPHTALAIGEDNTIEKEQVRNINIRVQTSRC